MQNRGFVRVHCTENTFMCTAAEVRKIIQQKAYGGGGHVFDKPSPMRTKIIYNGSLKTYIARA